MPINIELDGEKDKSMVQKPQLLQGVLICIGIGHFTGCRAVSAPLPGAPASSTPRCSQGYLLHVSLLLAHQAACQIFWNMFCQKCQQVGRWAQLCPLVGPLSCQCPACDSPWLLLIEESPAVPLLPKPCHIHILHLTDFPPPFFLCQTAILFVSAKREAVEDRSLSRSWPLVLLFLWPQVKAVLWPETTGTSLQPLFPRFCVKNGTGSFCLNWTHAQVMWSAFW